MPVNPQQLGALNTGQQGLINRWIGSSAAQRQAAPNWNQIQSAFNAYRAAAGGGQGGTSGTAAPPPGGATAAAGRPSWLGHASVDSIIDNPERLTWALNQAGMTGSLDDMLQQSMLGYGFSGIEQWRRNLAGQGATVQANPALQNVGQSLDINSLRAIVGQITGMVGRGQTSQLQDIWRQRTGGIDGVYQGVPDWAPQTMTDTVGTGLQQQLMDTRASRSGLGLPLDLLASPGINIYDPSQPLFGAGQNPPSLSQLTGGQRGESGFYRTLSAEELMRGPGQAYDQYVNRPAGAPAPFAGLTFGSSGVGQANPVRAGQEYGRYQAYGHPGDPTMRGTVHGTYGDSYNPLTGTGSPGQGLPGLGRAIASGQLRPEWLFPHVADWGPNQDLVTSNLGRVGASAFLNDPSVWFQGQYAPFAPGQLDPEVIARLLAVMQSTPSA